MLEIKRLIQKSVKTKVWDGLWIIEKRRLNGSIVKVIGGHAVRRYVWDSVVTDMRDAVRDSVWRPVRDLLAEGE
ncbi:MAG: hypothetical protein ACYTBJ_01325 [Planctomycetota bacterium]|jgi:hypothetical protein